MLKKRIFFFKRDFEITKKIKNIKRTIEKGKGMKRDGRREKEREREKEGKEGG